jgi:lycopene beta-cyclase
MRFHGRKSAGTLVRLPLMMNKDYRFIFAGGGLAGLSLASQLVRDGFPGSEILIIDSDSKNRNDRTWCFWTKASLLPEISQSIWTQVRFIGPGFTNLFQLSPYHYQIIRGIDFYRQRHQFLHDHGVTILKTSVKDIHDNEDAVSAITTEGSFSGQWLFNSLVRQGEFINISDSYTRLSQHFQGWEISVPNPIFNPTEPTLFDFRTSQNGKMRFFYVLPHSSTQALIEYTLFSRDLLPPHEYEAALAQYIQEILGIHDYQVLEVEKGIIPMTDYPFPRQLSPHVLAIGTRGGRVKASTGYAFTRIHKDSSGISHSLQQYGDPFHLPTAARRYAWFDAIMLKVIEANGRRMDEIFTQLFQNNPIQRVFGFLDEENSWLDDLKILASLTPWPFLSAAGKLLLRRR